LRTGGILFALGAIALLAGGAMVLEGFHHTIGYGVIAGGGLLVVIGIALSLGGKGSVSIAEAPGSKPRPSYRRALTALVLIALVGVGTFYGVNYLVASQSSTSQSMTLTSTSSSQTTQSTIGTGTSSSAQTNVTSTSSLPTSVTTLGFSHANFTDLALSLNDLFGNFLRMTISYSVSPSSGTVSYSVLGRPLVNSTRMVKVGFVLTSPPTPLSPGGKNASSTMWFDKTGTPAITMVGGRNFTGSAARTNGASFTAPFTMLAGYVESLLNNPLAFANFRASSQSTSTFAVYEASAVSYTVTGRFTTESNATILSALLVVGTFSPVGRPGDVAILTHASIQLTGVYFVLDVKAVQQ